MENILILIDRYFNTKFYCTYNKVKIYFFKNLKFNKKNNLKIDNYIF